MYGNEPVSLYSCAADRFVAGWLGLKRLSQGGFPHSPILEDSRLITFVLKSAYDAVDGSHHRHSDVAYWLTSEVPAFLIYVRSTPDNRH